MKANMGSTDRIVRILAAIVIGILYFTGQITGTLATILILFAMVFLVTAFVKVCPLYLPFGISTCKKKN